MPNRSHVRCVTTMASQPGHALRAVPRLFALLLLLAMLLLSLFTPRPAAAADPLVRFDDAIGSQPLRSGPAPNVVLGVNPGGIPWVISRFSADVDTDGHIKADGRGLLLAGGNGVGTTGGQSVRARLFCGGVAHDSALVPLDVRGDFSITGFLTPTPPTPCASPVLLIVSGGGNWFAAGIPKR